MLNKIPTDDQLWMGVYHIVTRCSLCRSAEETSQHLFLIIVMLREFGSYFILPPRSKIPLPLLRTGLFVTIKDQSSVL